MVIGRELYSGTSRDNYRCFRLCGNRDCADDNI